MMNKAPDIEQYWEALEAALPRFAPDEQRAAVTLYRELAKGSPVSAEQFAAALDVPVATAEDLLARDSIRSFVYPDEDGRVLGFGGLATAPMHHRFRVNGRTLYTWCAWDSLFIPEILGRSAEVESTCPETGELVRLVVTPEGIESAEPETAVVSFLLPDANGFDRSAANVMANFCHFVYFLATPEAGETWARKHPGTFLYSLEEAVRLARRQNRQTVGAILSHPRAGGRGALGVTRREDAGG